LGGIDDLVLDIARQTNYGFWPYELALFPDANFPFAGDYEPRLTFSIMAVKTAGFARGQDCHAHGQPFHALL
jgi:hypothetical protein